MNNRKQQQKTIWLSTTARMRLDELVKELGENASQLIVRLINEEYYYLKRDQKKEGQIK